MCRVARGLGNGAIVEVVDGVENLWCVGVTRWFGWKGY